jgi:hypothetical protein
MTGEVHRHQLLMMDKHQQPSSSSSDPVHDLEVLATIIAMDVLGELFPSQLQCMVSEGVLDAKVLIQRCDVDCIINSISETLWALKPVVDNLQCMSDSRGLCSLSGMGVELKYCMKKASFLHQLHIFLYGIRFCQERGFAAVLLDDNHIKRISSHSFAMGSVMDYMCKVAHFFNVDINSLGAMSMPQA